MPDDYRQFLLATNGGVLIPGILIDYEHREIGWTKATVAEFFGIETRDTALYSDGLVSINASLKDDNLLPPELLEIASTDGGHWVYMLSLSNQHFGRIYLWIEGFTDYDHAYVIAESFTEFLAKTNSSLPDG